MTVVPAGTGGGDATTTTTTAAGTAPIEPTPMLDSTRVVALVGNPNTGKSTLFGALSGRLQRTGNYPGVTVEKKLGRCGADVTRISGEG